MSRTPTARVARSTTGWNCARVLLAEFGDRHDRPWLVLHPAAAPNNPLLPSSPGRPCASTLQVACGSRPARGRFAASVRSAVPNGCAAASTCGRHHQRKPRRMSTTACPSWSTAPTRSGHGLIRAGDLDSALGLVAPLRDGDLRRRSGESAGQLNRGGARAPERAVAGQHVAAPSGAAKRRAGHARARATASGMRSRVMRRCGCGWRCVTPRRRAWVRPRAPWGSAPHGCRLRQADAPNPSLTHHLIAS